MAEANLECYTRREGRSSVLMLEGTLDVATAPQAIEAMQRALVEHGPNVVLDASRLDFIDSKGVGALLSGAKAARDLGGTLYLSNPAVPVRKILETCGLMSLFPSAPAPVPEAVPAPDGAGAAAAERGPRAPARPARRSA